MPEGERCSWTRQAAHRVSLGTVLFDAVEAGSEAGAGIVAGAGAEAGAGTGSGLGTGVKTGAGAGALLLLVWSVLASLATRWQSIVIYCGFSERFWVTRVHSLCRRPQGLYFL